MAAAQIPVSVAATLQFPSDASLPPDQVPFNAAVNVVSAQPDMTLNVSGSGSVVVPFGTVGSPGAKLVAVRYDPQQGASPILLTINSSITPVELTPGGFLLYISPNPAAGITALSIAYTASCQIKVWIAG